MKVITITFTETDDDRSVVSWDFGPDYNPENPTPLETSARMMIQMYTMMLSEQGEEIEVLKEH